MLVAQDFVNGGAPYSLWLVALRPFLHFGINDTHYGRLGRKLKASRERFIADMPQVVSQLYNVPSIFMWTLFNEGWGQFDSRKLTAYLMSLDHSRLVDADSGWYDEGVGSFKSHHIYFRPPRLRNDYRRILSLSEFGGYSLAVSGHTFQAKPFGYHPYSSAESLNAAIAKLYRKWVVRAIRKNGLSMCVYTQLSDVEGEINGIVTYDRKIVKLSLPEMAETHALLARSFVQAHPKKEVR